MVVNNGIIIVFGTAICPATTYGNYGSVTVTFPITFHAYYLTSVNHCIGGGGWGHCSDCFTNTTLSHMDIVQYQPFNFTKDAMNIWFMNIGY